MTKRADNLKQALDKVKYLDATESDNIVELQKKKLRGDLAALKETFENKIFEKENRSILKWFEKNTYKIVTISGFFVAIIGVIKPGYDYLVNSGKFNEAKFNSEMIGLIKTLSETKGSVRERSLTMLTTYNPEIVIPFLLTDMLAMPTESERTSQGDIPLKSVTEAIEISWNKLKKDGICERLLSTIGNKSLRMETSDKIYELMLPILNESKKPAPEKTSARILNISNVIYALKLGDYDSKYFKLINTLIYNISIDKELEKGSKDHLINKLMSCYEG